MGRPKGSRNKRTIEKQRILQQLLEPAVPQEEIDEAICYRSTEPAGAMFEVRLNGGPAFFPAGMIQRVTDNGVLVILEIGGLRECLPRARTIKWEIWQ
jgi:hypothetical protein